MKAPYLTVGGDPIQKGEEYYTVSVHDPHAVNTENAGTENNNISNCYFMDKKNAKTYSWMKQLHAMLSTQIKEIEKNHLNR